MRQITIFEAEQKRSDGIQRVESSHDDWTGRARDALHRYLLGHREFFCDDFWSHASIEYPVNGKALGPVVLHASRVGWMKKSGRYRPSKRSNMTAKPVWDSLIYRGGA